MGVRSKSLQFQPVLVKKTSIIYLAVWHLRFLLSPPTVLQKTTSLWLVGCPLKSLHFQTYPSMTMSLGMGMGLRMECSHRLKVDIQIPLQWDRLLSLQNQSQHGILISLALRAALTTNLYLLVVVLPSLMVVVT